MTDPTGEPHPLSRGQRLGVLLAAFLAWMFAGLEISLNVIPPGKAIPFLHRHQHNDEIYVVIGGRGQFLVDGECIDVQEGSVLRLSPPAARAWRNNSDAPFYFLCIQYRADSVIQGGTLDGQRVEGKPTWVN